MAKNKENKNFVLVKWVEEDNVFSVEKLKNVVITGDEIELGAIYDIHYRSGSVTFKGEILLIDSYVACNEKLDSFTTSAEIEVDMNKVKKRSKEKKKEKLEIIDSTESQDHLESQDRLENKENQECMKKKQLIDKTASVKRKRENENEDFQDELQITKKKLIERDILLSKQQQQIEEKDLKLHKYENLLNQYKANIDKIFTEQHIRDILNMSKSCLKLLGTDADLSELCNSINTSAPMVVLSDLYPKVVVMKQLKDEIISNLQTKASCSSTAAFRQVFRMALNDEQVILNVDGVTLYKEYSDLVAACKEFINSNLTERHLPLTESDVRRILCLLHNEKTSALKKSLLQAQQPPLASPTNNAQQSPLAKPSSNSQQSPLAKTISNTQQSPAVKSINKAQLSPLAKPINKAQKSPLAKKINVSQISSFSNSIDQAQQSPLAKNINISKQSSKQSPKPTVMSLLSPYSNKSNSSVVKNLNNTFFNNLSESEESDFEEDN